MAKPGAFFFWPRLPVTLVDKANWLSNALIMKPHSQVKQMRNLAPSIPKQSRSVGIDAAIGQIDLIGESGEIVKSWSILSPRCTIGSGLDCSIQLAFPGVASLHATLIFGKKHTLLRSTGPTLISNRHVREWLIDHSTEIVVGQSRLVIHPSMGVLATVVHAENLINQAARLCKELNPSIPDPTITVVQDSQVHQPNTSENSVESPIDPSPAFTTLSKLDSIERLLQSLKVSLDSMQSSIGSDTKNANESIVESVSQGMDEFGKRLFSTLNDQLNHQTGAQQSLISNLADRFTDRFVAMDDQLSRFSEANNRQANSLSELLAQASSEQELIEARFQEVISQRNELMEAVQVLRSEIAIAFQTPNNSIHQAAFASESQSIAAYYSSERESDAVPPCVTDSQLADSLERAQIQIHELNHQLRTLETERDSAQQRVANLSESLQSMQSASQLETSEQHYYEEAQYEEAPVALNPCDEPPFEDVHNDEPCSEIRQMPAWFKKDEPGAISDDLPAQSSNQIGSNTSIDSEPNFENFAAAGLNRNSDVGYESEQIEPPDPSLAPSKDKLDSISERLQRMLLDADQRRGTASSLRQLYRDPLKENHEGERAPPSFSQNQSNIDELRGELPSKNVQDDRVHDSDEQSHPNANEDSNDFGLSYSSSTRDDSEIENRKGADEEESIEQYMQRLLNRVRGVGESEMVVAPISALNSPALTASIASTPDMPRSTAVASMGSNSNDVEPLLEARKPNEELFVPRQQFPEQRNDLAALRELANTNARRAINRSDIRRTNSAFYVKLGITALAVSSAAALFMFNGFVLNAPFAGMVSSIIVSILWGYDCINHFKRLKNAGVSNRIATSQAAAGQSIQIDSADSCGWRPTTG